MATAPKKGKAKSPAIGRSSGQIAVIVTGGARGLGRAMTLALARSGIGVGVAELASSKPLLDELMAHAKAEGFADRILPLQCDVTRFADCERAVAAVIAHFGQIDGVVNNAGVGMQDIGNVLVGARKKFHEVDAEAWRVAIDVNVNGPFNMAKAVAPRLVGQGWGRIVNIETSTATMTMQGFSPYGPSKAALEAATVIWSKDLDGTGVTVNALAPGGAANTRMIPASEPVDRSTLVQPEAMQAPIVWLMSKQSDGVNGRRIIAKEWDAARLAATSADKIGVPAGW